MVRRGRKTRVRMARAAQAPRDMRVGVFGLGYVGCVTAACLAKAGHRVVGVDVNAVKVATIQRGESPVREPGLRQLLASSVEAGRLVATTESDVAVHSSDVVFVCVGTPAGVAGTPDLTDVIRVSEQIGHALSRGGRRPVVAVRSTLLPGTTEAVVIPRLERTSGRQAGNGFGVAYNPEFMREGTSIADFEHPSRTVIGTVDARSLQTLKTVYAFLRAPLVATDIRTAEMVKFVDNAFHALKVSFSNEVARLCTRQGLHGRRVMDIFALDRRLNLSAAYLTPGLPFGGPCLPKDLRALTARARALKVNAYLLEAILRSNARHHRSVLELIEGTKARRIGVVGLSFKPVTDDTRGSPIVSLVRSLLRRGCRVRIHDPGVASARLIGANRAYLHQMLPTLPRLLAPSLGDLIRSCEVVVVTRWNPIVRRALTRLRPRQFVVDLVGVDAMKRLPGRHVGLF